jgi:transposase-like protein
MLKERKEFYIDLIKNSNSLIEVCRKANIVPTTGNYDTLKKVIRENQIDISHFKRLGGINGGGIKKDISEYLINGIKVSTFKLKNRLLKEGYKEYRCEKCKNTEWYGKPIPLELHHINGDNTDNRLENLQLLCPNCHSFTDTYGGKNQKLNKRKKLSKEENDEIIKNSYAKESIKSISKKTSHSERTVKKVLNENGISVNKNKQVKENNDKKIPFIVDSLRRTKSFSGTAREFGVSDNAIKKLLVSRGYPSHIKEILEVIG